jgi:hypothetical protein
VGVGGTRRPHRSLGSELVVRVAETACNHIK